MNLGSLVPACVLILFLKKKIEDRTSRKFWPFSLKFELCFVMASDEVGGVADEHLLDDDVVAETGEYV